MKLEIVTTSAHTLTFKPQVSDVKMRQKKKKVLCLKKLSHQF